MKRILYTGILLALTFVLILSIFPVSAQAANQEDVLTAVSHTAAVSADVSAEHDTVTLTVPNQFTGDVDLSAGLDIAYNTAVYASASAGFPEGATAVVDGSAVKMLVTYLRKDEPVLYAAQYLVSVVRAAAVEPAFSGTISKSSALPNSIVFHAEDFTDRYTQNDGGAVAKGIITGSATSVGSVKLGNVSALGKEVTVAEIQNGLLTFDPEDSGTVSYIVSAYAAGAVESAGSAILTISVSEPENGGTVTYATEQNVPVTLKALDFSGSFSAATGKILSAVKFTLPAADKGVLYYKYISSTVYEAKVSGDTAYSVSTDPTISDITFVPGTDFSGIVSISYTGYCVDGDFYSGMLTITVNDTVVEPIRYSTDQDTPVSFRSADFAAVCAEETGGTLASIRFTLPDPEVGRLFYQYSTPTEYGTLVTPATDYLADFEPKLSDVDFVPTAGYTGSAQIAYTGYDTAGAHFSGVIIITIRSDVSHHFRDVGKNTAWAIEAIDYLYEQGIIAGDEKGYYNPQASISKGDYILMLCRAFDLEADFIGNFSDVSETDYFYDAVGAAKRLGIARGANGKFNPRSALSRQDAMVLLVRAMEVSGMELPAGEDSDLRPFHDRHRISDYAEAAFRALIRAGIIEGSGRALNPNSSISRAEVAVLLYRALTL